MNRLRLLARLAFSLALSCAPLAVLADAKTAHTAVQEATDLLLAKLDDVKGLYATEPDRFYAEIDQALSPYVDFERFARGVMAKYYRSASPEQRDQFQSMFKSDLIRTYSEALAKFDNETIVVLPGPEEQSADTGEITVKMEVHGKDGAIYPVQYSMVQTDGNWKLRNVIVNGLNIGLIFRKKFADSMAQNRNDISRVIAGWDSKVEASS